MTIEEISYMAFDKDLEGLYNVGFSVITYRKGSICIQGPFSDINIEPSEYVDFLHRVDGGYVFLEKKMLLSRNGVSCDLEIVIVAK